MPIKLDDRAFRRRLKRLREDELRKFAASTINGTAFEAQEEVKRKVAAEFDFAGPGTRKFLAGKGSFLVDKATESQRVPTATLYARTNAAGNRSTDSILSPHERGATINAAASRRLSFGGLIAIPIGVKPVSRGGRAVIPARLLPWTKQGGARGVLKPTAVRAGVFRAGNSIKQRDAQTGRVVTLFALVSSIRIDPALDFVRTVEDSARRWFPIKARERWHRLAQRMARTG